MRHWHLGVSPPLYPKKKKTRAHLSSETALIYNVAQRNDTEYIQCLVVSLRLVEPFGGRREGLNEQPGQICKRERSI